MSNLAIPEGAEKVVVAAATLGYLAGVTVMVTISMRDLRKADRDKKRAVNFANRLIDESWVYLPGEVKDKFVDEVSFFNISVHEGL